MRIATALLLVVTAIPQATAHETGEVVLPGDFWRDWHADPGAAAIIVVTGLLYASKTAELGVGRAAAFYLGLGLLAVALLSPLDSLSGTLLSAHMTQHVILIALAPPLLLIGRIDVALVQLLDEKSRRRLARVVGHPVVRFILRPVPAALIHGGTVLVWHAPPLFDSALESELVHALEHHAFIATALIFWYAILGAVRSSARRLGGAVAILVTLVFGGALGALLTLAPRPLYAHLDDASLHWGLSALADQQLAGLLMWVPTGAIYLFAGLVVAGGMLRAQEPRCRDGDVDSATMAGERSRRLQ